MDVSMDTSIKTKRLGVIEDKHFFIHIVFTAEILEAQFLMLDIQMVDFLD